VWLRCFVLSFYGCFGFRWIWFDLGLCFSLFYGFVNFRFGCFLVWLFCFCLVCGCGCCENVLVFVYWFVNLRFWVCCFDVGWWVFVGFVSVVLFVCMWFLVFFCLHMSMYGFYFGYALLWFCFIGCFVCFVLFCFMLVFWFCLWFCWLLDVEWFCCLLGLDIMWLVFLFSFFVCFLYVWF